MSKLKILFLDYDGVLNHEMFYNEQAKNEIKIEYPYSSIDPNCVNFLNDLVDKTDAKIVVSSTWKNSGIDYCRDVLEYHGFKGEIIDVTPNLRSENCLRGNEILKWIKDNEELVGPYYNFNEYVILDDDSDMLYWQRNNFILVDRFIGITPHIVDQATKILNG